MKDVIHIAPDIDYLFPATAATATVLCGRLASEVLASGEFVGVGDNLNSACETCPLCEHIQNNTQKGKE